MAEKSSRVEVLTGIYTALNVSALTSLLGSTGVTNDWPASPVYPFVRTGFSTSERWNTFGKSGKSFVLWVHIYSQAKGDLESAQIADKVHDLISYGAESPSVAVSVSNHTLARLVFEREIPSGDEPVNGVRTIHQILVFRGEVQQA